MKQEILGLTEVWYDLINLDHHKDSDCHWYINEVWSYGNKPKYRVEHYGYIWKEYHVQFNTRAEAEKGLIRAIKMAIKREVKWAKGVMKKPSLWDDFQVKRAIEILELMEEIK